MACMCGGDTNIENESLENYDEIFLGKLISEPESQNHQLNGNAAITYKIIKQNHTWIHRKKYCH